jgi:hypothetical protein
MTVSLPTKEIYSLDVPEVTKFTAEFKYNFFVPDEAVSDTAGVPSKFLERPTDQIDSNFIQQSVTRVPRIVFFKFKTSIISNVGNVVTDVSQRENNTSSGVQYGSLISDNLNKIVSEENFSSENFISVNYNDGQIDDKMYSLVSGSYLVHTLNDKNNSDVSEYKASQKLSSLTSKSIKPNFLSRAMTNNTKNSGIRFHKNNGNRIFDEYYRRLKLVTTNTQINARFLRAITNRTANDPSSTFSSDVVQINNEANKLKIPSSHISDDDYKTFVPYVDVKTSKFSTQADQRGAEIVGYIVDKFEMLKNGTLKTHKPIVIENPKVCVSADLSIKYDATYIYAIRAIAVFNVPAIDHNTGAVATLKILVSSKPSNKVYVNTVEMIAPPPPCDVNFTWDYDRINPLTAQIDQATGQPIPNTGYAGSLLIHWSFPPNSQRDIKKFQVFRRKSIDEPFELIKTYDFDDSVSRFSDNEFPDSSVVEYLRTPCTFLYDDDFLVGEQLNINPYAASSNPGSSTYIYSIVSIDAHGLTSNYSAQFEIWFDQFKNRLIKKLVSHSGAPKAYPNLYLENDLFIDTIKMSGQHSKKMKLYFNPEFYHYTDNQGRMSSAFKTNQTGGSYKLQFINLDNQKSQLINISIEDQISKNTRSVSTTKGTSPKETNKNRKLR